jgi:hypothetical protein
MQLALSVCIEEEMAKDLEYMYNLIYIHSDTSKAYLSLFPLFTILRIWLKQCNKMKIDRYEKNERLTMHTLLYNFQPFVQFIHAYVCMYIYR